MQPEEKTAMYFAVKTMSPVELEELTATTGDIDVLDVIAKNVKGFYGVLAGLRLQREHAWRQFDRFTGLFNGCATLMLRLAVTEYTLEMYVEEYLPQYYDVIIDDSFFYFMGADDFATVYAEPVKTIVYNETVTKQK